MKESKSLNKKLQTTPIAIIGISAMFPQSHNLTEYWDNILNKIDAIVDVPKDRWNSDDYFDPNPSAPDKSYNRRGGFLPDIDFDPVEFGLPPNILEATDVSQLLALVGARDCLENGGYGSAREFSRENVGVILGMVGIGSKLVIPLMARLQYPVWDKVLRSYGISDEDRTSIIEKIKLAYPKWEENSFPGSIGNVVAGRIANRFDLGGTNCTVDAACASSLAAIRMAVGELIEHRADMMLSGGVDTDNSIGTYMCFSKTPAFSKGDRVRSFDKESDGMMVGEGIGMVLLKRLDDAKRDGDNIYAVIKGIGTSSDGRFKSIYAPRPDGQSLALKRAYAEAGFSQSTVDLIEAHGTGTMAGDPAEFEGLNKVFSEVDFKKQHIALGTVKSQIAHTKGAAGVASLIKVALALHNKVLPATINVTDPNPKLNIENTPFYLNTEIRPWIKPVDHPRRAGVSSFGFGGTNFHVVMEENEGEHDSPYRTQTTSTMFLISAPNPDALKMECERWISKLNGENAVTFLNELIEKSKSAIPSSEARIGFVALGLEETLSKLKIVVDILKSKGSEESAEHPAGVYYRKSAVDSKGNVVALFPGQGSQYVDMGREAVINFPELRSSLSSMDALFTGENQEPLSRTIYPIPVFDNQKKETLNKNITATVMAQPAIGTLSAGFYKVLQNAGFKPDFIAGHSFGELTALWAGGVFSDADFFNLARTRGKAMAPTSDPNFDAGIMLAVKGDIEKLKLDLESFPDVVLANWNSNNQVVLAGAKPKIAEVQKILVEKGYSVVLLDVSAAFHTPLVGHAQKPFAEVIKNTKFSKPQIPVFSNSSGSQYPPTPEKMKQILSDHILNPVKFKDEIETIYGLGGTIFVEIGPKNILTNLVKNILDGKPHVAIALNPNAKKDSDRQLREAVTQLCVIGLPLQQFDPYSKPASNGPEKKPSAISVKLNGGLYLSPKTKAAFEEAILKKEALNFPGKSPENNPLQTSETIVNTYNNKASDPEQISEQTTSVVDQNVIGHIQQETLRVHSQYLENDAEYSRLFGQLTRQEMDLVSSNASNPALDQINAALQTLERSISQFHQHQTETLRMHETYLSNQLELMNTVLGLHSSSNVLDAKPGKSQERQFPTKLDPKPVVNNLVSAEIQPVKVSGNGHKPEQSDFPTMVANPQINVTSSTINLNGDALTPVLLEIVSEKTGYPTEMLELEMDMEADLGIDSIKRVEILGAMQDRFPELPKADAAALSEMRTLGQIIDYMSLPEELITSTTESPNAIQANQATQSLESLVQTETISGAIVSVKEITDALLEIVSEKTGYPTEMLELEMDMEADLGIDSIKRVEILGAMQERFPQLPKADAAALAEMRTLGQITNYMASTKTAEPEKMIESVIAKSAPANPPVSFDNPTSISLEEVTSGLLEVVSEKTGYPTEMLELGMDMEADLGIDSIKRVEILGAMQENYPDLPKADAAALAEMRTLQQIVESFTSPAAQESKNLSMSNHEEIHNPTELVRGLVTLKSLPLPDVLSSSSSGSKLCLIVDDGTDITNHLSAKLLGLGNRVAVLSLPIVLVLQKSELPEGVKRFDLKDSSEKTILDTIKGISTELGNIQVFIHLDPQNKDGESFSHREKEIVKTVFLLAKHLKDDLSLSGKNGFAAFLTVTHLDGQFGLSLDSTVDPVSGGLFGLTKTLNLEWDSVNCRAIDLQADLLPEMAAECIVAEVFDPNQLISEVAYNKDGRFTLVVEIPEISGLK